MNLLKRLWLVSFYFKKLKDKWNLEVVVNFTEKYNPVIFEKSEDALRTELEDFNKIDVDLSPEQLARKEEIEKNINNYSKVMEIYGGAKNELILTSTYLEYIKKCLK